LSKLVVKSDFKKQSFEARHDFAARSSCDLGIQGSNPNVACDTLSQYDDHSCEIVVKFYFKSKSYEPETIYCDLDLQGSDPCA